MSNLSELKRFGLAFFFFFKISHMILFLLIIAIVMVGIPAFFINSSASEGNSDSFSSKINQLSGHAHHMNGWIMINYTFFATFLVFIPLLFKLYIYKINGKDKTSESPSSFTVMIKNLPKNTDFNELKTKIESQFISKHQGLQLQNEYDPSIQVVDICFAYKIEKFVKNCLEYQKIKRIVSEGQEKYNKRNTCCHKSFNKLENKKKRLEKEIKDYCICNKDFEKNSYAFVTFKTIGQKFRVLYYYKMNFCQKFRYMIKNIFHSDTSQDNPYAKGILRLKSPPDPSDIIWQNLSVGEGERYLRSIISSTIGLTITGVSIMIIMFLQLLKSANTKERSSDTPVEGVIISLIIMAFNKLISSAFRSLANKECHISYTGLTNSLMKKNYFYTTANTSISFFILFLTDVIYGDFYDGNPHTPTSIAIWLLTESALIPILLILDKSYLNLLYKRSRIIKNKRTVDQKKANQIFTNPKFKIADRSVRYLRILSVVLIFSPLF